MAFKKQNKALLSIKNLISQYGLMFAYGLSSLVNKRKIPNKSSGLRQSIYTSKNDGLLRLNKLTKAWPNLPIFNNKKDPFID